MGLFLLNPDESVHNSVFFVVIENVVFELAIEPSFDKIDSTVLLVVMKKSNVIFVVQIDIIKVIIGDVDSQKYRADPAVQDF